MAVLVRTNIDTGGIMELYADGQLVRTVNLKIKNSAEAPIVLHGFDSSLPHVLQIRHRNLNPLARSGALSTAIASTIFRRGPAGE